MTTLPIWRLFPETFIATTYDLTNNEIGIYFRLLCWHWSNNKQRFNIKQATRIAQCNNDLESLEYILKRFFVYDEKGEYYHKRMCQDWDYAKKESERNRDNANKRWSHGNGISENDASISKSKSKSKNINKTIYSEDFENWWNELKSKDDKGSKKLAYEKFLELDRGGVDVNKIVEKWNILYDQRIGGEISMPMVTTFLNQRRDEGIPDVESPEERAKKDKISKRKFQLERWNTGFKTINDFDNEIIDAYKKGLVSEKAMIKMGFEYEVKNGRTKI